MVCFPVMLLVFNHAGLYCGKQLPQVHLTDYSALTSVKSKYRPAINTHNTLQLHSTFYKANHNICKVEVNPNFHATARFYLDGADADQYLP